MKKILKTNTKISASICKGGIKIFIHSPEIGNILENKNLATFIFKNYNKIQDLERCINFNDLVNFFITPEKYRDKDDMIFINEDFWYSMFKHIKKNYVDKTKFVGGARHEINLNRVNSIYNHSTRTINLICLLDGRIKDGYEFIYKGVYNSELISTNIVPLLSTYAAEFIKFFALDEVIRK